MGGARPLNTFLDGRSEPIVIGGVGFFGLVTFRFEIKLSASRNLGRVRMVFGIQGDSLKVWIRFLHELLLGGGWWRTA